MAGMESLGHKDSMNWSGDKDNSNTLKHKDEVSKIFQWAISE